MSHLIVNGADKTLDHIKIKSVDTGEYIEAWEARDKNDHLLWGRADTFTGTNSISARCYGLPVKSWEIDGNGSQTGTPTPDAPIMPTFCGTLDGTDWKILLTCAGQTVPVYLGQTQTVRKIRKLVLNGTEIITKAANNPVFTMQIGSVYAPLSDNVISTLSTHYLAQTNTSGTGNVSNGCVCIRRGYSTLYIGDTRYDNADDFKAWIAAQYAAGTPVTVWYVLAEPTTGIVNEPLCKIGDYADELSSTDAGATISTTDGNNTISVDTSLAPSRFEIKVHAKPYT